MKIIIYRITSNLIKNKWLLFTIALSISLAGFGIVSSIYSTSSQNAKNAEVNIVTYTLQADVLEKNGVSTEEMGYYKDIALHWDETSMAFRENAARRAYTAFWFLSCLVPLFFVFIVLLIDSSFWYWFSPLLISVILIAFAFSSFVFDNFRFVPSSYIHHCTGIDPIVDVSPNIQKVIDNHNWLKEHRDLYTPDWLIEK